MSEAEDIQIYIKGNKVNFTVVCEIILVASCWFTIYGIRGLPKNALWPASIGVFYLSIAAVLGALKFGGVDGVASIHKVFTSLGGVGVSCLGISFVQAGMNERLRKYSKNAGIFVLIVGSVLAVFWTKGPWKLPIIIIGFVSLIFGSYTYYRESAKIFALGLIAAVLIVTSALVIGTKGTLFGFLRLDLFHLTLACSILCQGYSLKMISDKLK